jgi:hypothetical protein
VAAGGASAAAIDTGDGFLNSQSAETFARYVAAFREG